MKCTVNENHVCRYLQMIEFNKKKYELFYCEGCKNHYIETDDFEEGKQFSCKSSTGKHFTVTNIHTEKIIRRLSIDGNTFSNKKEYEEYVKTLLDLTEKITIVQNIKDVPRYYPRTKAQFKVLTYSGRRIKYVPVDVIRARGVDIEAYFLDLEEYRKITKHLGSPILPRLTIADGGLYEGFGTFDDLKQESVLKKYGYHVGEDCELSAKQRQEILAAIVDWKVLSRDRVIGYLEFFIRSRESNPVMRNSILKWEEDIRFLRKYNDSSSI